MTIKYVGDTNFFLDNPNSVNEYDMVVLSHVSREFESLEQKGSAELKYRIRQAKRSIINSEKVTYDMKDYNVDFSDKLDSNYTDNKILQACMENEYGLATNDVLLQIKAKTYNIPLLTSDDVDVDDKDEYVGFKEITVSVYDYNKINTNLNINKYGLLNNEYLIVNVDNTGEKDAFKWTGEHLERVNQRGFTTQMFGKFKAYDKYQQIAVDSIINNDLTFIKGKAGSGKSLISLYTAWYLIEKGKFDKLIVFSNPTKARHAQELGFYKGTRTQKLLDSQIGIMLSSKFGDETMLNAFIESKKLEILPFSDIRGFDTSGEKKSIVWITEAQNLNTDLLKLGLQRIGDNTKVIVDGDIDAQVDSDIYRIDNGAKRMSQIFRGSELYGEVELQEIYRSKIAEKADEM